MRRKWCWWQTGFALSLVSAPAHAHSSAPGMEGLIAGFLHPFDSAYAMLAIASWGLLLSLDDRQLKSTLPGYVAAICIGLVLSSSGTLLHASNFLLALSILGGIVTAAAWKMPPSLFHLASVVWGLCLGLTLPVELGSTDAMVVTALGSVIACSFVLFYLARGASWLRKGPVAEIALRILGSWIATLAILLAALAYRLSP